MQKKDMLDCEKARILQELQEDVDPHKPAETEVGDEHATPPKEAAKPKKDKKKSPKERRTARRLEQARLAEGTVS